MPFSPRVQNEFCTPYAQEPTDKGGQIRRLPVGCGPMAPRFKQCMYKTYSTERGVSAMICFPFSEAELRFPFRDELAG
jgi:hypothetical protein